MSDQMPARTFWQWILMYPTLLISLAGAFPTFRDVALAIYENITVNELIDGRRQSQLWSTNIACLAQPIAERKTTPEKFEIGASVCPTGDVLVYIRSPEAKEFYRWIPFKTMSSDPRRLTALLIDEAYAAEPPPLLLAQAGQVVCQRSTGYGQVVRRIRTGTVCVDEFIDMTTGRLLRRVPARCDASCAG